MTAIAQHVRSHPPRCLATVNASPINALLVDRGPNAVTFRIARDAHEACNVLGYDLSDYNSNYDGPIEFISPLNLRWPDGQSTCIFDSDIHGYHGELNASAKLRGSGDATTFKCTACGDDSLIVDVQFNYYDDLFDEFDPSEMSNYFANIIVYGTCTICSHQNPILDMDL